MARRLPLNPGAAETAAGAFLAFRGSLLVVGYVAHVAWCASTQSWWLMVTGCLAWPLGIAHGLARLATLA